MSTPTNDDHDDDARKDAATAGPALIAGDRVVSERLAIADSSWPRMKGLLGRSALDEDEGLWITPCSSIHMFFMRFAIDVVFVDKELCVTRVHESVAPWRMARGGRGTHSAFELPAGRAASFGIEAGTRLTIRR